jgi:hypothetical protein
LVRLAAPEAHTDRPVNAEPYALPNRINDGKRKAAEMRNQQGYMKMQHDFAERANEAHKRAAEFSQRAREAHQRALATAQENNRRARDISHRMQEQTQMIAHRNAQRARGW